MVLFEVVFRDRRFKFEGSMIDFSRVRSGGRGGPADRRPDSDFQLYSCADAVAR